MPPRWSVLGVGALDPAGAGLPPTMKTKSKRSYTPSEFAGALTEAGVIRSLRWVQDHCKDGSIKTLPLPGSRYEIPGSELVRILDGLEGEA